MIFSRCTTLTVTVAIAASGISVLASSPVPSGAATATLAKVRSVDVSLGAVYTASGTSEYFSSPALSDLNGDSQPDLVVGAPNGTVTATDLTDGTRLWQKALGQTPIQASPAIADVDRDGDAEVIAATMDGRVVLLNGQTGNAVITMRQGAPLHCPPGQDCRPDGFFGTPAIGDVNGDGVNDIVAASYDHTVYAWSSKSGNLVWRSYLEDTIWSSPAIVDVDNDGKNEVVVGGDIYANNPLNVPRGGLMWVLKGRDGKNFGSFPKSLPGQTIWSAPVVTDLNKDGRKDIVVGTGTNYGFGDDAAARRVWAIDAVTGANLSGWPVATSGRVIGQPAVANLDTDGGLEVVIAGETGYLEAYEPSGAKRWKVCNASNTSTGCGGSVGHGGVVVADVDNDGAPEVVSQAGQHLRVRKGSDGSVEAEFRSTGANAILNPATTAAITEVDGRAIIAQSTIVRADSSGPAAAGDKVRTDIITTNQQLCSEDWAQFKGGPRRTSFLPALAPWHPFACARPFVAQQYRDLLGRELDANGREYWTALMRSGSWPGDRIVGGFMDSPEFRGIVEPIVAAHLALKDGPPGPSSTIKSQIRDMRSTSSVVPIIEAMLSEMGPFSNDEVVDGAYARLLGRAATVSEGQTAQQDIYESSQAAWLAKFIGTSKVKAAIRGEVQVALAYIGLLDRAPEANGWNFWIAEVARGISSRRLIAMFLSSAEYKTRVL